MSMSDTASLPARDQRYCWHPFTQHGIAAEHLQVVGASGVWLELADGRRVLDAIASWWANLHGHGHPAISDAIARQARTLDHVLFCGVTHEPAVAVAERLVAMTPPGLERVFYSDNGSTAVEISLKMAYQFWQNEGRPRKQRFVALEHAYHGDTIGAMSVAEADLFTAPFRGLCFDVMRLHGAHTHACHLGGPELATTEAALGRLATMFEAEGDTIAALILEPMVQGAAGMTMSEPEFLAGVRELCTRHDVLLIADEVMTGFGRTGRPFACNHADITPDLMCVSKGITGGVMALSATLATERIYQAFVSDELGRGFLHGHSYTANPIACAAALANMEIIATGEPYRRAARIESFYAERLPRLAEHPMVANARWMGTIGVVEIAGGTSTYWDDAGPRIKRAMLERGILVRPLGNVFYTLPPYAIEPSELAMIYDLLEELLDEEAHV